MVESPTYYRAYQPVLQTLQQLDSNSISFKEELVDLISGSLPTFLEDQNTFNANLVYKTPEKRRMTIREFLDTNHSDNSLFDESQEAAVKNALQNRIGIIQGPPGCGKSFIGVKMLELLLSLSPSTKVLVLTYKNHALDEFLKEALNFLHKSQLVRIGSRSKDPEIDEVSLANCKENFYAHKKNVRKVDIWDFQSIGCALSDLKDKSSLCITEIKKEFENLNENLEFLRIDIVLSALSSQHLKSLLLGSPWQWLPPASLFDKIEKSLDHSPDVNISKDVPFSRKCERDKRKRENREDTDEDRWDDEEDDIEIQERQAERISADNEAKLEDFHNDFMLVNDKKLRNQGGTIKMFSENALKNLINSNAISLLNYTNLWDMAREDRVKFIQIIIFKYRENRKKRLKEKLHSFKSLCKQIKELQDEKTALILKEKKVIGATITGASIHQQLLKEIQPEVVIVEEAAEVLEPQLLASLGSGTKYLLLIGDHQQLRPSVDSYELRKDYNFDISMMERLINNDLPYKTLRMQNRQREEFAELLFDIYPDLETNLERVKANEPAFCLEKSSFFWDHAEPEMKDRSVANPEEAKRAVKLALFLVQQGYEANKITILAMYKRQRALIRKILEDYQRTFRSSLETSTKNQDHRHKVKSDENFVENTIRVHTVDMYQGDENDFVIVSLVRSNDERNIGFVAEMNRRCVAQSRARCGVYFIGNSKMFINHKTWSYLMKKLQEDGRIGDSIGLVCKWHVNDPHLVKDSETLTLKNFCNHPCSKEMACGKHTCPNKCQPPHRHDFCKFEVQFCHKKCGHKAKKQCSEDERNLSCELSISATLPCGHITMKKCYQQAEKIKCEEYCVQKRDACGHYCQREHKCFAHGFSTDCRDCEKLQQAERLIQKEKERKIREERKKEINSQIEKMKKEASIEKDVEYIPLLPEGETHMEFLEIEDLVKKYIQPGHNWYPNIKEIKKVTNRELRIKFLKCSTQLFDPEPRVTYKFHGTDEAGVDSITKNGFKDSSKFGIVFSSDSSGSQQEFSDDSNTLILCEVYLGKSYEIRNSGKKIDVKELKKLKRDSLFIPRDKEDKGTVLYDSFVVFNPEQVFPTHIISFTKQHFTGNESKLTFSDTFSEGKKTIESKRHVNPDDPLEQHFAFVEGRFLRMLNRSGNIGKYEISHIDVYMNPQLEAKFNAKAAEFDKKYQGLLEAKPVYGFHGTKSDQIVDGIMNTNFLPSKSGKFGAGVYFSEQPSYTFGYGGENHLIMAKILPGKVHDSSVNQQGRGASLCLPGFDSHGGYKQQDGTFHEVVIFNTDQILPCYVIYFK